MNVANFAVCSSFLEGYFNAVYSLAIYCVLWIPLNITNLLIYYTLIDISGFRFGAMEVTYFSFPSLVHSINHPIESTCLSNKRLGQYRCSFWEFCSNASLQAIGAYDISLESDSSRFPTEQQLRWLRMYKQRKIIAIHKLKPIRNLYT